MNFMPFIHAPRHHFVYLLFFQQKLHITLPAHKPGYLLTPTRMSASSLFSKLHRIYPAMNATENIHSFILKGKNLSLQFYEAWANYCWDSESQSEMKWQAVRKLVREDGRWMLGRRSCLTCVSSSWSGMIGEGLACPIRSGFLLVIL